MFFYLTHKQMLYSLIQLRDFTWHSPWALKRNAFLAVPAKKSLTALQTGAMGNTRASSVQTGIKLEWQTRHAGGNLISILLPFKTDILINLLIILFNETGKEWTKTATQHKSLKLLHIGHIKADTEGKETLRKGSKTPGGRPGHVMIPRGRYICTLNAERWTYTIHNLNLFSMKSGPELWSKLMISK